MRSRTVVLLRWEGVLTSARHISSIPSAYCFGILHRVENPLGLRRVLRGRTASGGSVLVETYGVRPQDRDGPAIRVSEPGQVYAHDEFVYWGFGHTGLEQLARIAGFSGAESFVDVEVDGHPRIMGRLIA